MLTLVQENSHSGLTVREVAGAMRVSIPKLRRQVLAWFGHPPGTIIDLARVARLVVDLEISSDELKGIAFTYSFSSPSAMGRLFKRFVGVSPGRYRLVHRASN